MTRESLCQNLLAKSEHNLWKALLSAPWKDILLVPQAWYPNHTPKYETPGWWYAPAETVLGRTCKSCNAFCELADFTGNKRKKTVPGICFRCKSEDDRTSTQRGCGTTKTAPRKRTALIPEGSTLRRSARAQGQERVNYHECVESETQSDSDVTMTGVTGDYFTDSSCVQLTLDISPMVMTGTGEIYSSR